MMDSATDAVGPGPRLPASRSPGSARRLVLFVLLLTVVASALVAVRSGDRSYFGWGTETDYLGAFVPEAQRLLDGQSLELRYHPPVYPVFLSLAFRVTGDWLAAGLLLSGLAFVLALLLSGYVLTLISGGAAGLGAVIALSISAVSLSYASLTTTDLPYLAAYMVAVGLAFLAWKQEARGGWLWFLAGVSLALALGMRANSITLLVLLGLPMLRRQKRHLIMMLGGLLLLAGGWWVYSTATGTPVSPTHTYLNLALTYFTPSEERQSGDAWQQQDPTEMFGGLVDVVRHDPATMATTYLRDLSRLPRAIYGSALVPLPVLWLAVPGLFLLVRRWRNPLVGAFLLATVAQGLLNNFKTFEPRYYLFVVPVFGAAAGCTIAWAWKAFSRIGRLRLVLVPIVALLVAGLGYRSLVQSRGPLHNADAELSSCLAEVTERVPAGAPVVSRKPHVPHYAEAIYIGLPPVSSLAQLREVLRDGFRGQPMWCGLRAPAVLSLQAGEAIYLYFGRNEAKLRGELATLLDSKQAPDWLVPIGAGDTEDAPWTLYRFTPASASEPDPE